MVIDWFRLRGPAADSFCPYECNITARRIIDFLVFIIIIARRKVSVCLRR